MIMLLEPGQMLLHYRLVEMVGEGGMSVVWKGVDTKLDREVAIKILSGDYEQDPERLALFESEAKIVAALSHPNIVTIYSIEEQGGLRFITMELVCGKGLDEFIAADGLPLKRFFELAIPMSDAINAAHERGVTHGDLKPSNVMVSDDGLVKVLDFGLARIRKVAEEADSSDATTVTLDLDGRFAGTMAYMSPEQIQTRSLDHRSDIFTLGIIFYEMATGRRPFSGESAPALLASILKDRPAPTLQFRAELPRHLDRIINRCLEKEPRRRVQTALDLCNELRALERERGSGRKEAVRSIAVLPFTDLSAEKDQDHFCEGIAEEIINALVKIKDIRVAARTSSFPFKGAVMDSRELGDRLGVSNLLHGSVRKAGERLRISAELINVADGYRLWSERYDRELKDIFAIQDEISQNIVDALEVTLSPVERRAIKQVATTNVEAYDYYLRGRQFFNQYRRKGIQFALQMFSRAIECDPSYALAYAGMADCASFLYMNIDRNEAIRAQADVASKRALELDPELAEAHSARGVALSLKGQHDEAEEAFENSMRLNPKLFDAHYFYARDCFTRGNFDKAIELYEQASEISPEDYQSPLLSAQIYDDLGRNEEATAVRRRGIRAAKACLDLNPDDLRALYMGANGLVAVGELEKGLAWAKRAMEIEPEEPMLLYNLACIYALANETETAISCLRKGIERGFAHRMWLEKDSNLDSLRGDTRFEELVEQLG